MDHQSQKEPVPCVQVLLIFIQLSLGDSNPVRARNVKQNSSVNCFVVKRCADGYRKAMPLGRQAGNTRSGFIPDGSPNNKNTFVFESVIGEYIHFYNNQRLQLKTKLTPLEKRSQFVA